MSRAEEFPRFGPDMRRFVRRYVGLDDMSIDDAVQDAYVHWLTHPLGEDVSIGGALCLVARWKGIQQLRSFDIRERYEGQVDSPSRLGQPGESDPYLRERVLRTLERIRPEYAAVLVLRCVYDYLAPEIAEKLGISVLAVKAHLDRGRDAFCKAWQMGESYRRGRYNPCQRDPETGRFLGSHQAEGGAGDEIAGLDVKAAEGRRARARRLAGQYPQGAQL